MRFQFRNCTGAKICNVVAKQFSFVLVDGLEPELAFSSRAFAPLQMG
jgi:hypothetical protein